MTKMTMILKEPTGMIPVTFHQGVHFPWGLLVLPLMVSFLNA